MELFDTHCHLEDERFDPDRAQVIERLRAAGVTRCVTVGSCLNSSQRALAVAAQNEGVYAAAGVHPHEAKGAPDGYLEALRELLARDKCVALGEIGLDYYYDLSPREVQRRVFEEQLEAAYAWDVPVILHVRDAHGDVRQILRARGGRLPRGVLHCFSGSIESAKDYLSMGFYLSFAGPVTFKKAPNLWETAAYVPEDRLLIETDSPYLAPEPLRGRRNEPANVRFVCEKIAALRGVPAGELAERTTQNALSFYRLREA